MSTIKEKFADEEFLLKNYPVLLLFPKPADAQCVALTEALLRMNLCYDVVTSSDRGVELYELRCHCLVVVDARQLVTFDALLMCKLMRNKEESIYTHFVAIRSQGSKEKSEKFFEAGFDEEMVETCQTDVCYARLLYVKRKLDLLSRFRMAEAFYLAVQWIDEAVEICDSEHRIQFVNQSALKMYGYPSSSDLIGCNVHEVLSSKENSPSLDQKIRLETSNGKIWQGNYSVRKQNGESLLRLSRIIPLKGLLGHVFGYVTIRRFDLTTCAICNFVDEKCAACRAATGSKQSSELRGSSAALEKTSTDAVVNILTSIRNVSTSPSAHILIDRITDGIKLAQANGNDSGTFDVIAAEFFDGFILDRSLSEDSEKRERKSVDATSLKTVDYVETDQRPLSSIGSQLTLLAVQKVRDQLDSILSWNFNIFTLEELTNKQTLLYGGFEVFRKLDIMSVLNIDEATVLKFLILIESNYVNSNAYHNSTHACDVMQACALLCCQDNVMTALDAVDRMVVIVAAIIHDLGHPGRTNAYLVNSRHPLALLYNDTSVLENHHVSTAFQLMSSNPDANIFQNLERDSYGQIRQQVIDTVLATDMAKHFEHLNRFVEWSQRKRENNPSAPSAATLPLSSVAPISVDARTIIKRILIKMADISNAVRPIELAQVWALRISKEYFDQTDDEKANGLPIVMPYFDRDTCSIASTQITFMNLFITNLFQSFCSLYPVPEITHNLKVNIEHWNQQLNQTTA